MTRTPFNDGQNVVVEGRRSYRFDGLGVYQCSGGGTDNFDFETGLMTAMSFVTVKGTL